MAQLTAGISGPPTSFPEQVITKDILRFHDCMVVASLKMRYAAQYPKLRYLFAAYFHQHWVDEGSFEDVLRVFMEEDPAATVNQVTRELESFLDIDLPEGELHDVVVHDLGANVRAAGMGLTYRQWLEAVLAILKKTARGSGDSRGGSSSRR